MEQATCAPTIPLYSRRRRQLGRPREEGRPLRRHLVMDLASVTKPRLILLQLISTICAFVMTSPAAIPLRLGVATLAGGALMAASAGVLNCVWDRDIDAVMERTKERPLPCRRLSVRLAVSYAALLGVLGFSVLLLEANAFAAYLTLAGHMFYVVVYTLWLKRSTTFNIVIGGAAGGVPPLVASAALTGRIDLPSMLLFLLIVLWSPIHFWPLAMARRDDYIRAKIPMLPVIAGDLATIRRIAFFTALLLPVTLGLALTTTRTLPSIIAIAALWGWLARKVWALKTAAQVPGNEKSRKAGELFGFSVLYLGGLLTALVVSAYL